MIIWCCLLFAVVIQHTSAQVVPYGMPNRVRNIANNARGLPNRIPLNKGLPNGISRTMSGNNNNCQNFANNPYYKNANNVAYANPKVESANLANILENKLANDITTTAIENIANANRLTSIATPAIVNVPNGANYNFGNNLIPVTVSGRATGNYPVGINVLADNLEVKGLVTVVGRMPILGAVTLNGNVPSDGKAFMNYSCGSPAAV